MTGHDPEPRAPAAGPPAAASSVVDPDSMIEASGTAGRPGPIASSVLAPRLGGGLSLMIAFLGLLGAGLGAAWLGLDAPLGIGPGGIMGATLVVAAAALLVVGMVLVVGALGHYVLAPAFAGPAAAWRGVGS